MANMSLHKSAEWKPGLRTYFQYRDLGSVEATEGRLLVHVIRATESCSGPGGYHSHDLEFQMNYVLRGWTRVEFEDVGEVRFEAGDSWHQDPGTPHEVLEFSDDFEVIEICMPAEFPTRDEQR
ncbi:MAG: cupin domain-containing protein [Gemmatimonadaceae bacterium]|nr:cupin domain-containing protein [Gemmatimonadaceae bacterium]